MRGEGAAEVRRGRDEARLRGERETKKIELRESTEAVKGRV